MINVARKNPLVVNAIVVNAIVVKRLTTTRLVTTNVSVNPVSHKNHPVNAITHHIKDEFKFKPLLATAKRGF